MYMCHWSLIWMYWITWPPQPSWVVSSKTSTPSRWSNFSSFCFEFLNAYHKTVTSLMSIYYVLFIEMPDRRNVCTASTLYDWYISIRSPYWYHFWTSHSLLDDANQYSSNLTCQPLSCPCSLSAFFPSPPQSVWIPTRNVT